MKSPTTIPNFSEMTHQQISNFIRDMESTTDISAVPDLLAVLKGGSKESLTDELNSHGIVLLLKAQSWFRNPDDEVKKDAILLAHSIEKYFPVGTGNANAHARAKDFLRH